MTPKLDHPEVPAKWETLGEHGPTPEMGEAVLVRWPNAWKEGRVRAVTEDDVMTVELNGGGMLEVTRAAIAVKKERE